MGTLGQWIRKMKMASRLTNAHIMQKRMMPRHRRNVPPPPAGTTIAGPLNTNEPLHAPPPPGCWLCCSVLFNQQLDILGNQLKVWTYFQYGLQPLLLINNYVVLGEMFVVSLDLTCANVMT
uniref:Uncharacterized protein n=1 Tax=Sphaeramia orbicularis TaxID=375764 RepID=A0A673C0L2_9TELE